MNKWTFLFCLSVALIGIGIIVDRYCDVAFALLHTQCTYSPMIWPMVALCLSLWIIGVGLIVCCLFAVRHRR
jgi:hypothetical protein